MISGLNLHCNGVPVLSVYCGQSVTWIEIDSGHERGTQDHQRIGLFVRDRSEQDMRRAVEAFNAALAGRRIGYLDDRGRLVEAGVPQLQAAE